jgi:hypothetical protein
VPRSASTSFPVGAPTPDLRTVWSIGVRLVFDWRLLLQLLTCPCGASGWLPARSDPRRTTRPTPPPPRPTSCRGSSPGNAVHGEALLRFVEEVLATPAR